MVSLTTWTLITRFAADKEAIVSVSTSQIEIIRKRSFSRHDQLPQRPTTYCDGMLDTKSLELNSPRPELNSPVVSSIVSGGGGEGGGVFVENQLQLNSLVVSSIQDSPELNSPVVSSIQSGRC